MNDKKLKRMGEKCGLLCLVFAILASCVSKPDTEQITNGNLTEVLSRYGKENPETEVLIETDFGNMRIRLYEDTPLHRANFVKLIKEGHYEEGEFYRIFYQFMIQGGDFDDQLDYMIPAEFNTKYIHKKGALSMARQDEDNPDLKSSSTEFFIVHGARYADYQVQTEIENLGLTLTDEQKKIYMTEGGYMSLDQKYTVFGEVVEGLEVIDKIASVKVYNEDKPLKKIPFRISVK
ncbi:MAG TPA: peptidylprolyl isomerase [Chryseosolibacter sp.]